MVRVRFRTAPQILRANRFRPHPNPPAATILDNLKRNARRNRRTSMNKVITVNLNNNAYQVEEPGYEALQKYLDSAKASLADNPDKDEIIADLEQAIADKCASYLHTNKNVIAQQEIDAILKSMGPVETDSGEPEHEETKTDEPKID